MLPWDGWEGYKNIPVEKWSEEEYSVMDKLSKHCLEIDESIEGLNNFIEEQSGIKVPNNLDEVINYLK